MTIISSLVVFASLTGILSFGMWELDMEEIPILYQFGTFLASYWFHDKLKPGKPHYGNFASSGPPLVAVTGSGAARPWPYSDSNGVNIGGITFEENDTERSSVETHFSKTRGKSGGISQYTPVNGLYGVSNVRENSRDKTVEYYPGAIEPNDYIAKRLLGDHADWSDLVGLGPGGDPHLWNDQVFKDGSPFGAAEIGAGQMDSEKWTLYKRYAAADPAHKMMVPLTSTGAGNYTQNAYMGTSLESERDYSGGEYALGHPYYQSANHELFFTQDTSQIPGSAVNNTVRPDWYVQYANNPSSDNSWSQPTGATDIAAWPGESGVNNGITSFATQNSPGMKYTVPTFYDPMVSNSRTTPNYQNHAYGSNNTVQIYSGWGIPQPSDASGFYLGKDPKSQQLDYITTQLNTGEVGPVPVQNQGIVDIPPSITKPQSNKMKRGPRSRTYSR